MHNRTSTKLQIILQYHWNLKYALAKLFLSEVIFVTSGHLAQLFIPDTWD